MPGKKNYLDGYYDWMVRTGKKPKKKERPSQPMSPFSAKPWLRAVRRMLMDLGYVEGINNGSRGKTYLVWPSKGCRRIYDLKPDHLIGWINNEFQVLDTRQDKIRKANYVFAARKFGEYLHWELKDRHGAPIWTKDQLDKLKLEAYPPNIKKSEIEILPLKLTDAFIEFLKEADITEYTMTYLGRWFGGMRYQEIINAPLELDGPTLKINFKTDEVTIWGKGEGGLQKERHSSLLPEVKEVILEYLEYRKTLTPATPEDGHYLFLSPLGKKHSENSGGFNHRLRRHATEWGGLDEKELKLVSTHKIGRHSFGTYWAQKMPEKSLMKEMGIEDYKTVEIYINISRKERARIMKEARIKDNGNGKLESKENDKLSLIKELFHDLSKEEKMELFKEAFR